MKHDIEDLENRLSKMMFSCVTAGDYKGNDECRKIGKIILSVRCGSSRTSRLATVEKMLTNRGF